MLPDHHLEKAIAEELISGVGDDIPSDNIQPASTAAPTVHGDPAEVITDRAPALDNVIEDWVPAALHTTGQHDNNRVECDHGRLKARLRPIRGLKTHRTASVVIRGHAFIENLRRGHDELAIDSAQPCRLATAFDEFRPAI